MHAPCHATLLRSHGQKLTRAPAALMLCNSHNVRACVGLATRYARLPGFDGGLSTSQPWPLTPGQDRRPITPPPCVRLIVKDAKTGKEIDCK